MNRDLGLFGYFRADRADRADRAGHAGRADRANRAGARCLAFCAAATLVLAACAVTPYGYGDDGYYGGVYEPYGYDYGYWGGGYRVGPPRGGERGDFRGRDAHGGGNAHGPGPGGGAHGGGAPSIPHGARGGGGGHH